MEADIFGMYRYIFYTRIRRNNLLFMSIEDRKYKSLYMGDDTNDNEVQRGVLQSDWHDIKGFFLFKHTNFLLGVEKNS